MLRNYGLYLSLRAIVFNFVCIVTHYSNPLQLNDPYPLLSLFNRKKRVKTVF